MKKISIFVITVVIASFVFVSCNKVPTTYSTALPWTGLDPFSAIVNGKSLAPTNAAVSYSQNDTTPTYIFSNITEVVNADTTIQKVFTIQLPVKVGALNEFKMADKNNQSYVIFYREITLKGSTTVLKNKLYSTIKAAPGGRVKVLVNDATKLKGIFNGYLNNEAYPDEYIYIDNGYFNANK
jgi:hypothetical protein